MPERTTRGDEDRKREDEEMSGEPIDDRATEDTGAPPATTRDSSVEPAKDARRTGQGAEED